MKRTKPAYDDRSLEALASVILKPKTNLPSKKRERIFKPSLPIAEKETVKTTAISPSRKRNIVICSIANKCWYGKTCPHKVPHIHSEGCNLDFCSIMNFKNCKCVKPEEE